MPLSSEKIIKKEEAATRVMNFEAKPIGKIDDHGVKKVIDIQQNTDPGSGFVMDPLLSQKIQIVEKHQKDLDAIIEQQVIERLKALEEKVYKEAYAIGYDEGLEKGVYDNSEKIQLRIESLDKALNEISQLRLKLIIENEAQIVKLTFILAAKIAMNEIYTNPDYIVNLLRKLATNIHAEVETVVHFSDEDYNFLTEASEKLGEEFEFLKKVRLEADKTLSKGDCLIDTNYGLVDARVEERLNKVWIAIKDTLPRTSEPVDVDVLNIMKDKVNEEELNAVPGTDVSNTGMKENLEVSSETEEGQSAETVSNNDAISDNMDRTLEEENSSEVEIIEEDSDTPEDQD